MKLVNQLINQFLFNKSKPKGVLKHMGTLLDDGMPKYPERTHKDAHLQMFEWELEWLKGECVTS